LRQRKSWPFGLIILGLIIVGFLVGRFEFIVGPTLRPVTTVSAASPVVTPLPAQPSPALTAEPETAGQADQAQTKTAAVKTSSAHAKTAASQTLPPPVKTIGSKTAPITMEVFSDYQCPSCGSLYEQTLRPMINDYVASGKVYLVHRDFPLPMHPYGYEAARWVNAAARIGKYQEVEAALYDNQKAWSIDGSIEKYVAGAMSAADFRRVQKLMVGCGLEVKPPTGPDNPSGCPLDANIEADKELGNQVPVKATPTFITYFKGQKYPPASGVISWPVMKQYFDSLLAQ
jgi:protein-disulfide isomerase